MIDEPKRLSRPLKRERAKNIVDNLGSAMDELWDKLEEQSIPEQWMERIHEAVGAELRKQVEAYAEHEDCPNCGSDETKYHDPGFGVPTLMRCGMCGLRWAWEGIRQSELINKRKQ